MNAPRKLNLTVQYTLVFGALLLAANILLGFVLFNQSRAALRSMLETSMLDVTNTAAGLLDGDGLAALTEADADGAFSQSVIDTLNIFQERVEIEFIYVVRQAGEDRFVFIVDPDPVEPAAFGEEIVYTYALGQAGKGIATVDSAPMADRWGDFYSAYSPVFDSQGNVGGIVGVDFGTDWYEHQLRGLSITVFVISALTVLIGAAVIVLITSRTRKRFRQLSDELGVLSADVDELTEVITSTPGYQESLAKLGSAAQSPAAPAAQSDEIGALSDRIRTMEQTVKRYLDYAHAQANTDALTGVGNTSAYQERVRTLERRIADAGGDFAVAVFDIDLLKGINDAYGHTCGDMVIRGAATVIERVFGKGNVYRIGGDEFLAVAEHVTEQEMEDRLTRAEAATEGFTMPDKRCDGQLSISGGAAVFRPGQDKSFKEVFIRADDAMYRRKGIHHQRYGVPPDRETT